ncbi:hypothetical protein B0T20DRAFT_417777 [Sordaria brevicollis]|uniref:Uncharacterized protein n=1 Tax=Sordaria brevicollis TaxID=83679 RepID=A0AAE0UAI5_SORBR|nr:hypothetical protein B0T20DRAFT_417777 [Sordaria brevicollis]
MASPFTSPQIPPNTPATGSLGPFPTPTHGQPGSGTFTIACSAHIKASPRTCLEVLLKAAEYPAWNRYCRKCIIDGQPSGDQQPKKAKKEKKKKESKPKAGKPREPVDIPVAVPDPESADATATVTAPEGTNLSATNSHSSSGSSSLWSDHQSLPNLVGPEFLRLGTKFTFEVHMDPLADNGTARDTALEVSRLERIDEVVERDVKEVVTRPEVGVALPAASAGGGAGGSGDAAVVTNDPSGGADDGKGEGGNDGGGGASASASASAVQEEDKKDKDTSAPTTTTTTTTTKDHEASPSSVPPQDNNPPLRRTGFCIAWKTRPSLLMPNWLLRCERVQEFVEVYPPFGADDEPETAYQCWETFYGVLAPVVKAAAGSQVIKGFDVWMDGLRKRAEEVEGVSGRGE